LKYRQPRLWTDWLYCNRGSLNFYFNFN